MARPRGKITRFSLYRSLAEYRLTEIESFVHHSRSAMKGAWEKFSKDFDRKVAGWDEDRVSEYVDMIYDDMSILRDESPQLLRYAQCMVVYGTFETSLVNLANALNRDGKITADLPKKTYMDNMKVYLRPHFRIRPAPFSKEWQSMHEFRIIRNWMAHNGGKVEVDTTPDGKWAQANRFVHRNRGLIKFTRHGDIVVEDALVDRAIRKASIALATIEKAAQMLY
jgi:hypothetical protein